eukprot:scaffold90840_cov33-Tisochrysis_lutea.AAC.1
MVVDGKQAPTFHSASSCLEDVAMDKTSSPHGRACCPRQLAASMPEPLALGVTENWCVAAGALVGCSVVDRVHD